jgi:cytochrome P450
VSRAFTPRAVERVRPIARTLFLQLLDGFVRGPDDDVVAGLCAPYPVPVLCALLGIEDARVADMSRWSKSVLKSLQPTAMQHFEEMEVAQQELEEYAVTLIDKRRVHPRDDLLSGLIAAEEQGDRLTSSELVTMIVQLLVAGTETIQSQLSNILHTLATHPAVWSRLSDGELSGPDVVEEAIRWEPAQEGVPRVATQDVTIGGIDIPAGTFLVLSTFGANQESNANVGFDPRSDSANVYNLAFGGGVHHCLGASLARLELIEAVDAIREQFVSLELAGRAEPARGLALSGYARLPLRLSPHSAR